MEKSDAKSEALRQQHPWVAQSQQLLENVISFEAVQLQKSLGLISPDKRRVDRTPIDPVADEARAGLHIGRQSRERMIERAAAEQKRVEELRTSQELTAEATEEQENADRELGKYSRILVDAPKSLTPVQLTRKRLEQSNEYSQVLRELRLETVLCADGTQRLTATQEKPARRTPAQQRAWVAKNSQRFTTGLEAAPRPIARGSPAQPYSGGLSSAWDVIGTRQALERAMERPAELTKDEFRTAVLERALEGKLPIHKHPDITMPASDVLKAALERKLDVHIDEKSFGSRWATVAPALQKAASGHAARPDAGNSHSATLSATRSQPTLLPAPSMSRPHSAHARPNSAHARPNSAHARSSSAQRRPASARPASAGAKSRRALSSGPMRRPTSGSTRAPASRPTSGVSLQSSTSSSSVPPWVEDFHTDAVGVGLKAAKGPRAVYDGVPIKLCLPRGVR